MATFPRNIVFLSSLMFLLFISFSYAITGADINAICSQAMNPSFCQSFLSNPKTLNIHLPTLASIIVEIAQASASGTLTQIQSPAQKETNPDLKQVYTTCSENYDNVAGDLNEAKAYLAAGDTPTVNIRVSSAMDGVNTCLKSSLLLACLAVFLLPVTPASAGFSVKVTEAQISTICSQAKTTPPGFCLKFLKSNPRTAKLDLPGLAKFTIDSAHQDASSILNQIRSLAKTAPNPRSKEVYSSCSENYDDAIGNFQDALEALAAHDPEGVNIQVSAAFDQADTCREDLKRISQPTELLNKIVNLENICHIALVISNMLPK